MAACVAAVVVLAAAAVMVVRHQKSHTLSAPEVAVGYPQLHDARFAALQQQLSSQFNTEGLANPIAAFYGTGSTPVSMVIAFNTKGHTRAALMGLDDSMQSSIRTPLANAAAGPIGGELQCGTMDVTVVVPICIWSDNDTIGTVALFQASLAQAPDLAVQFRAAVEH